MFQSEKKPGNPVNKNQENDKTRANSHYYYTIMQQQNKALNSINSPVQLKEEEEKEPLQAKAAPVQRMVEEEEGEKPVQAKTTPAQMMAGIEKEEMQMKQGGKDTGSDLNSTPVFSKMNQPIQEKMESSFGIGFSDVNIIHNDPSTKQMGALAYTQGEDVHFAPGRYNPETQSGQELLGHELTHVVQQRQGRVSQTNTAYAKTSTVKQGKGMAVNDNPSLETEADNMGKKAANGQSVGVVGKGSGVQKQDEDVENNEAENNTEETLSTTLGLSGSVGKDCTNSDADVLIVKNKLIEYGFLESSEATQNQINDAIGEFQKEVLNFSKPDKQISANGATDRALTSYYSPINKEGDYDAIENQIETDFTHAIVKAGSDFATSFDSNVKINSSSTVENVNLTALITLRNRLNDFGNSFSNTDLSALLNIKTEELSDEQKTTIKNAISATTESLKTFQNNKNIKWWSEKKSYVNSGIYVITGNSTKPDYNESEIKEDDATFIYLRDHKKHTFTWNKDDGSQKNITLNNFVKSYYTVNTDGVGTTGSEDPSNMSSSDFQSATGLNESKSKALKEASTHEGKFDAVNAYDNAKVSFGFIQFAGGNRSFEYLFARIKLEKPSIFNDYFGQYGVDVEFRTNSNDKIKENTCRIVVHDEESNTTYRGIDAEEFMSKNAIYAAMMIRAGANSDIKNMQLKVAKEKYVDISEAKKLDFVVKAIKVAEGGVNGPKDIVGADNVAEYKKTDEYETNNTNGKITEIDLDLKNMTLGEVLASEKELAALYGTYINTPGTSISSFRDAIEAIIIDKGLTTEQEVKNIDPVELLTKAKELNTSSIHKGRIQDAIDEEGLSS